MRIWADVFNTQDVKLGAVTRLNSISVTKGLDGAGSVNLTFPASDQATLEMLLLERRVQLYIEHDNQPRLLGKGVIRDLSLDPSNTKVIATGPDSLDALTRKSVLLGRSYDNQTIAGVAADLLTLVPGWTANVTSTGAISGRFDGSNVLSALIRIAEEQGIHIRESLDQNVIDIGAFGDDNGVVALKPGSITAEIMSRDSILIIDNIKRKSSSRKVYNWIVPLGAGEGGAALTLRDSSHTIPSITGPDGNLIYYLFDQDSIDAYGQSEKVLKFAQIVATEPTEIAKQYAADMLYDQGMSWLRRNSQPQDSYSMTAKKCRTPIRPGDKIKVMYKGFVEAEGGIFTYLDIDAYFWIMKVTNGVNDSGESLTLEISTVDRLRLEAEGIAGGIVQQMEIADVRAVSIQPNFNLHTIGPEKQVIDSTHSMTMPLKITDATHELVRCMISIKSQPIRADVSGAASHTHLAARTMDGTTPGAMVIRQFTFFEQGTGTLIHANISTDAGAGLRLLDAQASGGVSLSYGPYDDTVYPDSVSFSINGVVIATGLGTGGVAIDEEISIAGFLIDAVGGLRQEHQLLFTCAAGKGEIQVRIEVYSHISPINLN